MYQRNQCLLICYLHWWLHLQQTRITRIGIKLVTLSALPLKVQWTYIQQTYRHCVWCVLWHGQIGRGVIFAYPVGQKRDHSYKLSCTSQSEGLPSWIKTKLTFEDVGDGRGVSDKLTIVGGSGRTKIKFWMKVPHVFMWLIENYKKRWWEDPF